jgi:uncharacterized membrane-anchored protein YitT (DUF2179 family)
LAPKQHKKEPLKRVLYRVLMIIIGACLAAFAIERLLVPNKMIDGGIIGVSLILDYLIPNEWGLLNFATLVIILNAPFMYFGYKQIGKTFMLSTILGVVILGGAERYFHHFAPLTNQPILAAVFGGLALGLGVGLVIRHGGSLDGTEILGILLTKKIPFSVGEFVMFVNVFIFGWAAFVLGLEPAMYSVMTYYIASKMIDAVVEGLDETRAAFIVTDHYEEISSAILHRLGRGTTKLIGKGGYTDEQKEIIYAVVTRLEVTKLKSIINEIDPNAFITIMATHEVRGARFKSAIH